jgi:glycosyltransferase involved in cell wall biosynthesis
MVSVVIATDNCERALVRTLSALVGASVSGVVRDVVVADGGSSDETVQVADMAGCTLLVSSAPLSVRLREAVAAARGSWLLFLQPGIVLESGWDDAAARHIDEAERFDSAKARAAVFRSRGSAGRQSFAGELLALVKGALGVRPDPGQGFLISRALYDSLGGHRDGVSDPEADLLARLGRRLVRLGSGVTMRRDGPPG